MVAGLCTAMVGTIGANAAEEIRFFVRGVEVKVSVDTLEAFATTGELTGELVSYASYVDDSLLEWLQAFLSEEREWQVVPLSRLLNSSLGRGILEELGEIVRTNANLNGHRALRAALIGAASERPEGWTSIDVLRRYPSDTIRIDNAALMEMQRQLTIQDEYREAVVAAIAEKASNSATEAGIQAEIQTLPTAAGPFQFIQATETFNSNAIRQTGGGLTGGYSFDVDFYIPEESARPAPLVVVSHGFGSLKENLVFIAEQLATYGFAVAVPEHVGSDLRYREEFFQGTLSAALSPLEFLDRPGDISFLLDELERLSQSDEFWSDRIDLERIGVMGVSLGGTTALSLAGAQLNQTRLSQDCAAPRLNLNLSQILQCQASYLPPFNVQLEDPRIDAAIAAHALSSSIFGPEGIAEIDIPIALIAGGEDAVAPVILEQIHPFVWLTEPEKYLVLLEPGSHWVTTLQPNSGGSESIPDFLRGNTSDTGREFFKGFSVAFFSRYLNGDEAFAPYLSQRSVTGQVGEYPLTMHVIRSLTAEEILESTGQQPPIPIVPAPLTEDTVAVASDNPVLQDISQSGVLKVGIRRDASPFGFIDAEGQWTGYCTDLAEALALHLETELNSDISIDPVYLQSTLENRFDLVRERSIHLECGPNTIRTDLEGIEFSNPFFVTGTQFFTPDSNASDIKPTLDMAGVEIGVLEGSLTAEFISNRYPRAEAMVFVGDRGREAAIQALAAGEIDAFATDGILAVGEAITQLLPLEDYTLIPPRPLTCDFYGFVLPEGDLEWRDTVNRWLDSDADDAVWERWFETNLREVIINIDFCVNQGGN
ncbi:MAG: alpha/beta hydrolase [Synechococcus sp.]